MKHLKRNLKLYSVDIVSESGILEKTYNTNTLKLAEKKFIQYVEKLAFKFETVQMWSRLNSDEDIELIKESKGKY